MTRRPSLAALALLWARLRTARYLFAVGAAIIDAEPLPVAMRLTLGRGIYRLARGVSHKISTAFRQ